MISKRTQVMSPSPTLAIGAKARAMREAGEDVISLSVGEPDFPTPEPIVAAAIAALKGGDTYYSPAAGKKALREALAEEYAKKFALPVSMQEIIVGIGAKQILFDGIATLVNPGDEVLLPAPYWVSFPQMVYFAGGTVVPIVTGEESGYVPSTEQIEAAITPKTRLIILNFPHNPTGAVPHGDYLPKLAELLRKYPQIAIISDETYERLIYTDDKCSILSFAPDLQKRTLVVGSFSKAYAMTGWRLGYAYGPKEVIAAMGKIAGACTSGPASFVQTAGVAALKGDQEIVTMMRDSYRARRDMMAELLGAIPGVSFHLPEGTFYMFINVKKYLNNVIKDTESLATYLLENEKLAVVPGLFFGAEGYLRLSFAISEEHIKQGVARLKAGLIKLNNLSL